MAVAGVKARTAPQNGESIVNAPWLAAVSPSSPPKRHMSVAPLTTKPVAPCDVPALTPYVRDPNVMLPTCVAVGAVHAFTVPHASIGARKSTAGGVGVGAGVGAGAGLATVPQALSRAAKTSDRCI